MNGKNKTVMALVLALLMVVGIIPLDFTHARVQAANKVYEETIKDYVIDETYNFGKVLVPKADGKYPVMIYVHGAGNTNVSSLLLGVMEKWVSAGYVEPMVVVMPQITHTGNGETQFGNFVSKGYLMDLVNYLKNDGDTADKPWKAKIDKSQISTIAGYSMGGSVALFAGVKHPTVFKNIGGLSPSHFFYGDDDPYRYYVKDPNDLVFSNDENAHLMMAYGAGEQTDFKNNVERYLGAIESNTNNKNKFQIYVGPQYINSQTLSHSWQLFARETFCFLYYLKFHDVPSAELIEGSMGNGSFPPYVPPTSGLKIAGKSLALQDTISINFMLLKADLQGKYHDPYLVVTQGDRQRILTTYREAGDYLVFNCRVAPQMIGEDVVAVPHALSANGEDIAGDAITYSVARYCYNMLNKEEYADAKYATLRRLLVDILRYGDASQKYLNYKTESLASSKLTNEQEAMGTDVSVAMTYGSVKEKNYKTVNASDALASIENAALYLEAAVNIRYKFSVSASVSDPTALRIVITDNAECTNVIAEYPVNIDNRNEEMYYVTASCLNAIQMKKTVYATVMKGDKKVSNTYRYSIESYAASIRGKEQKLDNLMDAMMRYGNSAADFVAGK